MAAKEAADEIINKYNDLCVTLDENLNLHATVFSREEIARIRELHRIAGEYIRDLYEN
jgi:hypothetical protein